jgi:hypothetical protein
MAGFVLTSKATFQCKHSAPITLATGVSITGLATHLTINGAFPILSGATIGGFIAGVCTYAPGGTPDPCTSFILTTPPSEIHLVVDGKTAYTQNDVGTIQTTVQSTGNMLPGLLITETEVLVSTT